MEYDVFGELRIYEIAPAWRLIGKVSLHGAPDCIGLHESTAYVGEGYVLKAIDFSDEATPHVTAALSVGTITTEAKVLGDTLYTATGCGLNSYDLHVPTSPAPLPSLTGLKYADRMAVDRTRAVIAQSTTLSVFTRPAAGMAPTLGHADVPGWISDLALLGDHAVVSTFDRGIRVVNVSDPSAPYVEGFAYSAFAVYEVELVGNYAVTASSSGGVRIFDLSNPGAPQFVRAVNAPTSSYSVAVSGSYAFVPCGTSLLTIDLHDPPNATIVATTDLGSYYGHIVIGNGVAYISDQGSPALLAVDISDPWNPALVAQVESPSFIDLFLTEDRLYGVVGSGDVYPFDLTVPSSPIALPPLGVTDALAFAAGEGAAVVQHAYPRATLLDLSDPLMPRGVGSVSDGACGDGTYFGSAVAERDAIFYLGVGTQGLWTLARPCLTSEAPENSPPVAPPRPFLVGGPNPFRPALSAAFHIEARGVNVARAPIDIVNAGGRLVRRLDFGEPDVLRQHVEWDGRDDGGQPCPSGVYLFRTPSSRTSGRVIVIR
ncbi:MAG: FlgD immunoglobulin-like domain containing protein [Candidatus Eisenbacteria bacterium]